MQLCMLMHSCAYSINQCTSEYQILVQEIFIGNDSDSCEIINTILKLIYQTFGKYKTITKHSPYISFNDTKITVRELCAIIGVLNR